MERKPKVPVYETAQDAVQLNHKQGAELVGQLRHVVAQQARIGSAANVLRAAHEALYHHVQDGQRLHAQEPDVAVLVALNAMKDALLWLGTDVTEEEAPF